ncbi:MAG: CotH kinase family protein [Bacteroidota bacterium]
MKTIIPIIISSFLAYHLHAQNDVIAIDDIHIYVDTEKSLVLINKDTDTLNTLYTGEKNQIELAGQLYAFTSIISELEIGKAYEITNTANENFVLYFTQLPIVHILTSNTIVDEPRVAAQFTWCESNSNHVESAIGIEYSGGWTQTLPKKSFRIEFWENEVGSKTKNISFLGMRKDDDWNLQAMYNEPLRLRGKANFELWRQIDTLHYQMEEPEAVNGVRQEYVELFLNNSYRGVYAIGERPDRKQFKLKKYKDREIRGELYKGVNWGEITTYASLPSYDNDSEFWGGMEYKYPDEIVEWNNIYAFFDFILQEDSLDFYDQYAEKFDIDNAINYFIFMNLLRAYDNTGKNLFIAKYDADDPYFYIPWDLDGTFGIWWNGTKESNTKGILTNGFYERLLQDEDFTERLVSRWNSLRKGVLTLDNIMEGFKVHFDYLNSNAVYDREVMAWQSNDLFDFKNLDYTSTWLNDRLNYLDNAFENPESLKQLEEEEVEQVETIVYPNPATNQLKIVPSDNAAIRRIQISNSLGQVLQVYAETDLTADIDISNLADGIYFIDIATTDGKRTTKEIIVKRK